MLEAADRLQLIVDFANADLNVLTREGQHVIEDTVFQVAVLADVPLPTKSATSNKHLKQARPKPAWPLPEDGFALLKQLPKLQEETRNILGNFLNPNLGLKTKWTSLGQCRLVPRRSQAGDTVLMVHGRGRDMFLLGVLSLLTLPAARRLQRCPECSHYFFRSGKQKFCTRVCTNKSGWRNWPPEKKEEARRKQYEKAGWTRGTRGGGKPRR